jgi:hypothetical protein
MSGFTGWVDLDRAWLPAVAPADSGHWRRDGLDITAARDCDVAADRKRLAIVRGSPRIDDGALQGAQSRGTAHALLLLYERDGLRALERLRGRYSICIVDGEGGSVLLATDRFAVYPICWAIDGKRLAFADRLDRLPLRQSAAISLPALYSTTCIFTSFRRLAQSIRMSIACALQKGWSQRQTASTSRDIGNLASTVDRTCRVGRPKNSFASFSALLSSGRPAVIPPVLS